MDQTKPRVFLNRAEETAYDREQHRRQEGDTHGDILPFKKGEDGGIEWAWPQWVHDTINAVTLPKDSLTGYEASPEDVTDFALSTGAVGMGVSKALAPKADLGMFVGKRSKLTPEQEGLAYGAEMMDLRGEARKDIWEKTGWWKGPDKKWRTEIPDDTAEIEGVDDLFGIGASTNLRGDDIIRHPELKAHYPDLSAEQNVATIAGEPTVRGRYSQPWADDVGEYDNIFVAAPDYEGAKNVLLHELQHAVQSREGFSSGANAQAVDKNLKSIVAELPPEVVVYMRQKQRSVELKKDLDDISEAIEAGPDAETVNPYWFGFSKEHLVSTFKETAEQLESATGWTDKYRQVIDPIAEDMDSLFQVLNKKPFDLYQRNMGEAEARLVQKREKYTPEQRRAISPWDDYDVPEEELLDDDYWLTLRADVMETLAEYGYYDRTEEQQKAVYEALKGIHND